MLEVREGECLFEDKSGKASWRRRYLSWSLKDSIVRKRQEKDPIKAPRESERKTQEFRLDSLGQGLQVGRQGLWGRTQYRELIKIKGGREALSYFLFPTQWCFRAFCFNLI